MTSETLPRIAIVERRGSTVIVDVSGTESYPADGYAFEPSDLDLPDIDCVGWNRISGRGVDSAGNIFRVRLAFSRGQPRPRLLFFGRDGHVLYGADLSGVTARLVVAPPIRSHLGYHAAVAELADHSCTATARTH